MSTRVLVLNGPNLGGTLGTRQPHLYGSRTFADVADELRARAAGLGCELRIEHSNHEGGLIDILEAERGVAQGCIINPGGLSHTSVALLDALLDFGAPVIEVHISNILARDDFRRVSITARAATSVVFGFGTRGYVLALDGLCAQFGTISDQETT